MAALVMVGRATCRRPGAASAKPGCTREARSPRPAELAFRVQNPSFVTLRREPARPTKSGGGRTGRACNFVARGMGGRVVVKGARQCQEACVWLLRVQNPSFVTLRREPARPTGAAATGLATGRELFRPKDGRACNFVARGMGERVVMKGARQCQEACVWMLRVQNPSFVTLRREPARPTGAAATGLAAVENYSGQKYSTDPGKSVRPHQSVSYTPFSTKPRKLDQGQSQGRCANPCFTGLM